MVVRIKTGKRIQGALSYNERKVTAGKAELILASRFGAELHAMGFSAKLARFRMLIDNNQYVKSNTLHLSLNFSPNDKLSREKMQMIAHDYMMRIGFGDQPFLVYWHKDTRHPHLHIVTTNIQANGRAIDMFRLGVRKSEPARKAMEKEFDLIPAESMKRELITPLRPVDIAAALYSQEETKRQISNIVKTVTNQYHFTNLEELNNILRVYNVQADPGLPGSRDFPPHQYKGAYFMRLDGSTHAAPHHYVEALMKRITFPKLSGFLNFGKLKQHINHEMISIPIVLTIHNLSKFLHEKKLEYRILSNRFDIKLANQRSAVVSPSYGTDFVKNARSILHYNMPHYDNFFLVFNMLAARENPVIGEIQLSLWGENSPVIICNYTIQIFGDANGNTQYEILNQKENVYLYDSTGRGESDSDRIKRSNSLLLEEFEKNASSQVLFSQLQERR